MFKTTFSKKKEIITHLLFWIVAFIGNTIKASNSEGGFFIVEMGYFYWAWNATFILTFYFNYILVLPIVFRKFKWLKLVEGLLIATLFFVGIRYCFDQVLGKIFVGRPNYYNPTFLFFIFNNILFSIKPIALSSAIFFFIYLIRLSEHHNYVLLENKNTEIKFLKTQFNSHFVFNTLNNIYSMVFLNSKNALPAIEKLSQIMRFTTYETQKKLIPLSKEIAFIHSYIDLEKLRHTEGSFIYFKQDAKDLDLKIPPYILSPLVENAIKHGVISNKHPIEITLNSTSKMIEFKVKNKIAEKKKDDAGGVGLDNLKKRLEINYSNQYSFLIDNHTPYFTTTLKITLK